MLIHLPSYSLARRPAHYKRGSASRANRCCDLHGSRRDNLRRSLGRGRAATRFNWAEHRLRLRRGHIPQQGETPARTLERGRGAGTASPIPAGSSARGRGSSDVTFAPMQRPRRSTNWSQGQMHRTTHHGRLLSRLLFVSLLGYAFASLRSDDASVSATSELDPAFRPPLEPAEPRPKPTKRRSTPRRVALGTLLTVIFFAGAAFTAGAGNEVASKLDSTDASAPAQAPAAADPSAADAQPAAAPDAAPAADPASAPAPAADPNAAPAPADAPAAAPASAPAADPSAADDAVAGSGSGASAQVSAAPPAASSSAPTTAAPTGP